LRRPLKNGIAWLLLLLLLAGGCMAPSDRGGRERVPSPTSALTAEQPDPAAKGDDGKGVGLTFTEVRSSGDREGAYTGCEGADWFELGNLGTESVDLGKLYITNDPEKPDQHRLPKVTLKPGRYLAVCCCGGEGHPSVSMGIARRGETLYIFNGNRQEICRVAVPPLEADISWGLLDGTWGYCTEPTPGRANERIFASLEPTQAGFLGVAVSELLIDGKHVPVAPDGSYSDFVELHNDTDGSISLKNWYLSDNPANLDKWAFPDVTLGPGEYLLVLLGGDGKPRADGLLQADFAVNRREQVVLYDADALAYSVFPLPEKIRTDVSVGPDGAYYLCPTPGRENGPASYTASDAGCYDYTGVFISEVCAYAGAGNNDWIELYNATGKRVSLEGWQICKDREGSDALALSGVIAPGGYAVFETTSHQHRQKAGIGAFGLSMGGETLYLLDETGRLRDQYATGVLKPALSSGRIEGNGNIARVFFRKSTKGGRNSDQYALGYAKAPVFSETGLYQTAPFELTLTSGEGAIIRYTVNGSEPTAASAEYTEPIPIQKNTVIRAFAQQDGLLDSEIVTYTFLFEEPHELPVVCVALKPKDLDALSSARSKVSASKEQRKGYFSYYEGGRLATEFPADFKTKGAGTLGYKQLSLTIHLRGKYGQSSVTYPFFKEYGWREYTSLCIRNSGQDNGYARIRDSYAARLCFGLNIDVAVTRPVAVYINGRYYGLYDLNEDQNDDYLESHFGVDKDQVEIIRYNSRLVKGSKADWNRVINYAKNRDLSKDAAYETFAQWVDPDYFIDYLVCSIYLSNGDMANQKYWHTKDNAVRWRAIFYDFDYAMGYNDGSVKRNLMKNFFSMDGTPTASDTLYTYIPAALVQNKAWRQRFIERYVELTVTTFAPERADRILRELQEEMASEMPRHIARWGKPASYAKWLSNVDAVQKWMDSRPAYALDNLRKYFNLKQSYIDELVAKYTPAE
jgi:hypothetical protein